MQDWWGGVLLLVFSTAGLLLGKGTIYGASMFPITLIILFPTVSILASRRAGAILLLLASLFLPAYVYLSGLPIATAIPLYVMIGAMYGISKFLWRRTSREMTVFLECIHQVGAASGIEEACLPALNLSPRRYVSTACPHIFCCPYTAPRFSQASVFPGCSWACVIRQRIALSISPQPSQYQAISSQR